jgi:PhoPQ-activated pathogenicity-related protein
MGKDGSIRVKTEDKPKDVVLWQATNPKARDFRLESVGKAYASSKLDPVEPGVYVAKVPKPATGWTAFFVELTFESGGTVPFKFSSPVNIVPDVLPHKIVEASKGK